MGVGLNEEGAVTPPVRVHEPEAPAIPLVFDSPHSGRIYPPDFDFVPPLETMRQLEDTDVDDLFATAPAHGATLIAATFPRTYIDTNRTLDSLDPGILDEPWPDFSASEQSEGPVARGLIRPVIGLDLAPIYDRKLTLAEVRHRIDRYWRPYHDALQTRLDDLHRRFGAVWHVNCHAMAPVWGATYPNAGKPIPHDAILGTRDGTTCEPAFTAAVRDALQAEGWAVAVDDTMKGVALVRLYSDPGAGRHSLQIEINRKLYAEEKTFARHRGYPAVRGTVDRLIAALASFVRDRTGTAVGSD